MALSLPLWNRIWTFTIVFSGIVLAVASLPGKRQKMRQNNGESIMTKYMSDHCRFMVLSMFLEKDYDLLNDQVYLMMQPLLDIERSETYIQQDCVTTFAANPGYELLLHFQDVAIDYRNQYISRLHIYDGQTENTRLTPYHGLYGETSPSSDGFKNIPVMDYVSHGQALTLHFTGFLSKRFYGFKAVLTPIKRQLRNGTCPGRMFQCVINKFCIEPHLVCNGIRNCGERDSSDEARRCTAKSYQLTDASIDDLGLMIGCGVSILILLLAVVWVAVMCHRRYRLRRQRRQLNVHQASDDGAEGPQWPSQREGSREEPQTRWLPRAFCDHVTPWMFREPPPSYTESVPEEVTANFDLPPPYAKESAEYRSLIWSQHSLPAHGSNHGDPGANIIANPGVVPSAPPEELPPGYEETAMPTPHLLQLLLASRHVPPRVSVNPATIAEAREAPREEGEDKLQQGEEQGLGGSVDSGPPDSQLPQD